MEVVNPSVMVSRLDLVFLDSAAAGIDFCRLPQGFWNIGVFIEQRCVMTHKYRGSIVVLSLSRSVEPNEEQKEMISGFQQGILCKCTEISGNRQFCDRIICNEQQVNKVQQGGPILFVEKDKPGQTLIQRKALRGHMGIIVKLVFITFI